MLEKPDQNLAEKITISISILFNLIVHSFIQSYIKLINIVIAKNLFNPFKSHRSSLTFPPSFEQVAKQHSKYCVCKCAIGTDFWTAKGVSQNHHLPIFSPFFPDVFLSMSQWPELHHCKMQLHTARVQPHLRLNRPTWTHSSPPLAYTLARSCTRHAS